MTTQKHKTRDNLLITLLGTTTISRKGQQLTQMLSGKAVALLAYLMLTRGVHSRAFLALLLWSDQPETQAKKNLRNVLPDLRTHLSDYITITRQSVEFNVEQLYESDAEQFERVVDGDLAQIALPALADALKLYNGEFMEGFHVRNARLYESWLRQQRAYFYRLAVGGWEALARRYVESEKFEEAEAAAKQLLTIELFNETGHQMLMHALHGQNRQKELVAQYTRCVQILQEELGVQPSAETTVLYNKLKATPPRIPQTSAPTPQPITSTPTLIKRDIELNQLDERFAQAQNAEAQLVLVRGDRGSGKTALLENFAQRVSDKAVRVLTTSGSNITPTDELYRIFRNLLRPLAGRWPQTDSAVSDHVLRKIKAVGRKQPLVLIFDDLHWADSASWTLFYELVQQLRHECVLIVASYRVTWRRNTHWDNVLTELLYQSNCTIIDLDKARRRHGEEFINDLLDKRPNQLPSHFRKRLFTLTQGHPLLTTAFLDDLEERGVISQSDTNVVQLLKPSIWDDLPESLVELLESWLQPVPPELRQLLRIASVEGNEFTAPVVKAALPDRETHLLAQQLGILDWRYGIIDPLKPLQIGRKTHARYSFRYPIMRQYLYERRLTPLERSSLPEVLGLALNELFSV